MTWAEFKSKSADLHFGTEHAVELDAEHGRVVKITIPPKFGLVPACLARASIDLRSTASTVERQIEFIQATPLEYLERWTMANEVFEDDVQLASVLRWADGLVSFVITQPQYHGHQASQFEIDAYFDRAHWTRIFDPSGQHHLFFNHAFGVLAIDALPRNCHVNSSGLQPFDVILCRPDAALESFLKLYPDI